VTRRSKRCSREATSTSTDATSRTSYGTAHVSATPTPADPYRVVDVTRREHRETSPP
jgi:hypothetical protein